MLNVVSLTARGFVLKGSDNMGTWNVDVGIAGFQIVAVPEPLAGGVAAVGALLMLVRRRKA